MATETPNPFALSETGLSDDARRLNELDPATRQRLRKSSAHLRTAAWCFAILSLLGVLVLAFQAKNGYPVAQDPDDDLGHLRTIIIAAIWTIPFLCILLTTTLFLRFSGGHIVAMAAGILVAVASLFGGSASLLMIFGVVFLFIALPGSGRLFGANRISHAELSRRTAKPARAKSGGGTTSTRRR